MKSPSQLIRILLWSFLLPLTTLAEVPADFTLQPVTGNTAFKVSAHKGKFIVMHFLLKTECPYCLRHTRECASLAKDLPDTVQIFIKPDSEAEIRKWAEKLPKEMLTSIPLYRDPDAGLAAACKIPDGYQFHGQTVHFPALIILDREGKEVFRYIGKSNADRFSPANLKQKLSELAGK